MRNIHKINFTNSVRNSIIILMLLEIYYARKADTRRHLSTIVFPTTFGKLFEQVNLAIMDALYQIIILGDNNNNQIGNFLTVVKSNITELGIDINKYISFLDTSNINLFSNKSPAVGVFFGGENLPEEDIKVVEELVANSVIIIPVVSQLTNYSGLVPSCLYPINGMELKEGTGGLQAVSSVVLESLNLLRNTRKLFISYKRQESKAVAIQLYEHLDNCGFDVFLDTISIRPGEPFQEALWHKLTDTDIVIILDTPKFLESRWTTEELANADAMSIGILQLIWPIHNPEVKSSLSLPIYLDISYFKDNNFNNELHEDAVNLITKSVESIRARSLAARYQSIVKVFSDFAKDAGAELIIQPNKYLVVTKGNKSVAVIPAIGVPEALRYQEVAEWVEAAKDSSISNAFLLYDHRNIRHKWCNHLDWLDKHLPIKTVRLTNADNWLNSL